MTLPSSGTISINNIMSETGSAGGSNALSFLGSNVKGFGGTYSLSSVYGLTWYQKNNTNNCTLNGGSQCSAAFNSGNYNCGAVQSNPGYDGYNGLTNCNANGACNCACNCDNRAWLQSNCNCGTNCNCAYNCIYNNCNCMPVDCSDCGSSCFPAFAKVLMFDGQWKNIQHIKSGDFVMGANGIPTKVLSLYETILGSTQMGNRKMFTFKEDTSHEWSEEHCYWTKRDDSEWWWSINPTQWVYEVNVGAVAGLKDNNSLRYGFDSQFATVNGWENRTPIQVDRNFNTPLYLPITEGVPIIINGYVVAASVDESLYDYTRFKWDSNKIKIKE